jgi:choline-sulfatase
MGKSRRKRGVDAGKVPAASGGRAGAGRRLGALLAGLVVVVAAAIAGLWWFNRPAAPTSNVIVFLIDTVRRDAVTCYGGRPGMTPRIDAVAADGVRFDQAVSTSGWTVPAVASLLTGTWPTIHGSEGKGLHITPMRTELPVAAELFKKAGFGTVGFATSAFVSPLLGVDRGFDLFDHEYSVNWQARRADTTITLAISQLEKRKNESTFYFIHLFDAHLDYDPPGEYATMYTGGRTEPKPPLSLEAVLDLRTGPEGLDPPTLDDQRYVRATYDGEMAFMDSQIGRFIDELKTLGLYEGATIVIVADHGEEFWEHRGFEHGHTLYDELVNVPLIMKFPSNVPAAVRTVPSQVRMIDIAPTLFELYDIDPPESFIGQSLMPFVRGESTTDLDAYCESTLYGPPRLALRGSRYKYIAVPTRQGLISGELYDWREDPGETANLAETRPEIASKMGAELTEWFRRNTAQAEGMSAVKPIDMHPDRIKLLRSLGYVR